MLNTFIHHVFVPSRYMDGLNSINRFNYLMEYLFSINSNYLYGMASIRPEFTICLTSFRI